MTDVVIYQPTRNPMQSGRGNIRKWVLEYEPRAAQTADPLMGWTGSADTTRQLRLRFDSKEEAVNYAERQGMSYRVVEPAKRRVILKNYADKFAWNRVQ